MIQGSLSFMSLGGSPSYLSGSITVASNATLNLVDQAYSEIDFSGPTPPNFATVLFTNYGTVNWSVRNLVANLCSLQINNYGLWDAKTNSTFSGANGGTTTFNNCGTFRKSGGDFSAPNSVTRFDNNSAFNNSGTLDIEIGGLILSSGSGGGMFNTVSNAGIFLGNYTLTGNPNFTGGGGVQGYFSGNNAFLHGALILDYGSLAGVLNVATNGELDIVGIRGETMPIGLNAVVLTNYGTVVWSNLDLQCQSSPLICNYGLWDAQTNNTFYGGSGGGMTTFNNYGTFRKSGGPGPFYPYGTVLDNNTTFNNVGTVDVQIGFLHIYDGSDSGVFSNVDSTTVYFDNLILTGNPAFFGNGIVEGYLTGNNAVINGDPMFNYVSLSGALTVATNAVVNLMAAGSATEFGALLLTNFGTVIWNNGDLSFQSASLVCNVGLWAAESDNTLLGGSSGTTFNNYGTFRKSGGYSPSGTQMDASTAFDNFGTVDDQAGQLFVITCADSGLFNTTNGAEIYLGNCTLSGDPNFTGTGYIGGGLNGSNAMLHGTINYATSGYAGMSGVITVASNCVFNLLGNYGSINLGGVLLTNRGTVNWMQTDLSASGAQIENYALWNVGGNATLSSTIFNNNGTFRKSGGALPGNSALDNSTTLNNFGTADVQTGLLALQGNYSLTGGTLNFGINNSNDYGSLDLTDNAVLAGALSVNFNNGYSPAVSNSFPLVTYGSESGMFASLNLPLLPKSLSWQSDYGPTAFTLSIVPPPALQLTSVTMSLSNNLFSFSWNGTSNQTYQVQCATNLSPANWADVGSSITGTNGVMSFSDGVGSNPQKFYRLEAQ